jgi:hypothetical protein
VAGMDDLITWLDKAAGHIARGFWAALDWAGF